MVRHHFNIALIFATAVVACAFVIGFNRAVDPYGSFTSSKNSHTITKAAVYRRVKLAKAYDIRRLHPEAIVLGSSRSHIGFRMTHPGWNVPRALRYNAAFDGATTEEMYRYLVHAEMVHPLRQVLLGLDTWHLNHAPSWTRPDFDPALLFDEQPLHNALVHAHDVALLLSADTTRASISEIFNAEARQSWLSPDGQRRGNVFFRDVAPNFTRSPAAYFWNTDRQEIGYALDVEPAPKPRFPTSFPPENKHRLTSFDYIGAIVSFCRKHSIDLRIVITPAHAHQLEIVADLRGWEALENGKRELVMLLARDAERNGAKAPFPLYDFSDYSAVTTEPVPPLASRKEMQFYWDSSHFKEIVGDWVLDRVFGVRGSSASAPADFGHLLDQSSIEADLSLIRQKQAAYRKQRANEVAAIAGLVRDVKASLKYPKKSTATYASYAR